MKTDLKIKELQDAIIYTKAAIARVLGTLPQRLMKMQVWWAGIWIWVKGKRPRLFKKSIFQTHFVEFRKSGAKNLTASATSPTEYWIKNCGAGTVNYVGYKVKDGKPRYECGCMDFLEMRPAFKAPACKHIYAVLSQQGFGSIKESIAQHKQEFDARSALGI
jgi:hypothetical protein